MPNSPIDAPIGWQPSQGPSEMRGVLGHQDGYPSEPASGCVVGFSISFSASLLMYATLLQPPAGLTLTWCARQWVPHWGPMAHQAGDTPRATVGM